MNLIKSQILLKIFSNAHRRSILKYLSISDRYAYELAKLLQITPRAVAQHLTLLLDSGLVKSESRKSDIGPNRDYFTLSKGLIFRISVGRNLFYFNLSRLDGTEEFHTSPNLQLNASPEKRNLKEIFEEGLDLLPRIKKELGVLEYQQTRLLRKYQGMLQHVSELLTKQEKLGKQEISLLLELLEKSGSANQGELLESLSLSPVTLSPIVTSLINRGMIKHNIVIEEGRAPVNEYSINF